MSQTFHVNLIQNLFQQLPVINDIRYTGIEPISENGSPIFPLNRAKYTTKRIGSMSVCWDSRD